MELSAFGSASDIEIIRRSPLFEGIRDTELPGVLRSLDARELCYDKGETIVNIGSPVRSGGIVLSGKVEVAFYDESANQLGVSHLGSESIYGAVLVCAHKKTSTMHLIAESKVRVLSLDFVVLTDPKLPDFPWRTRLLMNLTGYFARRVLFFQQRFHVIGQKKIRDKLKVYFRQQKRSVNGTITVPLNQTKLSEYLFADRSALSRELGHMRDEGIIDLDRNTIRILDPGFLNS